MREDMYKVIVERPRRWKARDSLANRLRNDLDGPLVANVVDGTARARTVADFRYDVVLRRRISRAKSNDR